MQMIDNTGDNLLETDESQFLIHGFYKDCIMIEIYKSEGIDPAKRNGFYKYCITIEMI